MSKDHGWICPKCGRVHAPWVPSCEPCNFNAIINQQRAPESNINSIHSDNCIRTEPM